MNMATPNQEATQIEGTIDPLELAAEIDQSGLFVTAYDVLNGYIPIFLIAFLTTIILTPIIRRIAVDSGIIDNPDGLRKLHSYPVAYMGGISILVGLIIAIGASYVMFDPAIAMFSTVPISVIIGMLAISLTGLADDIWGWDPRLKIAGQLVAAAALAIQDIGVRVAQGLLYPLLGDPTTILFQIGSLQVANQDVYYWIGTIVIGVFVLGACNSSNLIDGLDGLLSGTVAIMAIGFVIISCEMAVTLSPNADPETSLAGTRIILSLALLGAVLGFLPYNFKPAVIFLGDSGSLLLGYMCIVIILMFGDRGQTHLVFAGLIIFALPIMDTLLAIVRRKISGASMSDADHQHIHHQLLRAMKSVPKAVFTLYGVTALFTTIGVLLASMLILWDFRIRVIYVFATLLFTFIGAVAIKNARLAHATHAAPESDEDQAEPSSIDASDGAVRSK